MCDPASKEKGSGRPGQVGRTKKQSIGIYNISRVWSKHYYHHQTARKGPPRRFAFALFHFLA